MGHLGPVATLASPPADHWRGRGERCCTQRLIWWKRGRQIQHVHTNAQAMKMLRDACSSSVAIGGLWS